MNRWWWLPPAVALFAAAGCGAEGRSDENAIDDPSVAVQDEGTAAAPDESPPLDELICDPQRVGPGDSIHIRMPPNHGPYLAVRAPDETIFMLAFPALGDPTVPAAVYPEETFAGLREVILPVATRTEPWNVDARPRPIFEAARRYVIIAGVNLESDADYPGWHCVVEFVGNRG